MKKVDNFLLEIEDHPKTGTSSLEQLKHYDGEVWSRRLNKEYRFVYRIYEGKCTVLFVSSLGHYGDK